MRDKAWLGDIIPEEWCVGDNAPTRTVTMMLALRHRAPLADLSNTITNSGDPVILLDCHLITGCSQLGMRLGRSFSCSNVHMNRKSEKDSYEFVRADSVSPVPTLVPSLPTANHTAIQQYGNAALPPIMVWFPF